MWERSQRLGDSPLTVNVTHQSEMTTPMGITADPLPIVTLGETMAAFVSTNGEGRFVASPAGAESNVAIGLVRLGIAARWVSRLGDDPLGRFVAAEIESIGVDTSVVWDPHRPTGVLVKHPSPSGSHVSYYRRQSAATALAPADLARAEPGGWWHVTGITPALSDSAATTVRTLVERQEHHGRVSFDFNFRSSLWTTPSSAARILVPLAQRSDVVFIGDDEAEALFGTADTDDLADLILRRPDQTLILKCGSEGAIAICNQEVQFVPALAAEVVDVTGAGDAFAAGYLAARYWGWPIAPGLRLGHVLASRVVSSIEDFLAPLPRHLVDSLSPDWLERMWTQGSGR